MKILNNHTRTFPVNPAKAAQLMETLASPQDRLWPVSKWPKIQFDKGLETGARGGHGPIKYEVEKLEPGRKIVFRFRRPGLLRGFHVFEIVPTQGGCTLSHVIEARPGWYGWLLWPLVVRPLHDALLEDALDRAELALTGRLERPAVWSVYVQFLRKLASFMNIGKSETRGDFATHG